MYWTNAAIMLLLFAFVVTCGLLCLVVMMQRSKQEGLGAAFGGGFTDSVWGAQTSQVLVKATVWLAAFFFLLSIGLARLYAHRVGLQREISPVQQELLAPVTKPTAVPAGANVVPIPQAVVPTATPMTPTGNLPPATNAAPSAKPAPPVTPAK
jgi:preprotein translocase subunit SecG